jgi:hypothetical protein
MVEALIEGERDPATLAELAKGKLSLDAPIGNGRSSRSA